jgi:hypothetical protein
VRAAAVERARYRPMKEKQLTIDTYTHGARKCPDQAW